MLSFPKVSYTHILRSLGRKFGKRRKMTFSGLTFGKDERMVLVNFLNRKMDGIVKEEDGGKMRNVM